MALNPLDDLMGNTPNANKNNTGNKQTKAKKKSLKANPIFKELRPIMYYGAVVAVGLTVATFTIFDETKAFYYKNLTDGLNESETLVEAMKRDIDTITTLEADTAEYTELVKEKQAELTDANLVRTPLEQSFYFTAYLDSLINKHNIDLVDMHVKATRTETGEEIDLTEAGGLPASGYNLLPIDVEFESTYQNVANLFNDFYTKRIVYDEDLVITNKLDGTVNVKMTVKFENDTEVQQIEGEQPTQTTEQTGQEITQPTEQTTPPTEQPTTPTTEQQNQNVQPFTPVTPITPNTGTTNGSGTP